MRKQHKFHSNIIYDERTNELLVLSDVNLSREDKLFIYTYHKLYENEDYKMYNGIIGRCLEFNYILEEMNKHKDINNISDNLKKYNI